MRSILLIGLIYMNAPAALAYAAGYNAGMPSWYEHVDLISMMAWALITVVAWFMIRTLRKIDANQALLFSKLDRLSEDFYKLQGEHNAIKSGCCK
jgi:hypothetical protein